MFLETEKHSSVFQETEKYSSTVDSVDAGSEPDSASQRKAIYELGVETVCRCRHEGRRLDEKPARSDGDRACSDDRFGAGVEARPRAP